MKFRIFVLLLACLLLLMCACSSEQKIVGTAPTTQTTPSTGSDPTVEPPSEPTPMGTYSLTPGEEGGTPSERYQYSELPVSYTPEEALADGCMVLQWDEGATSPRIIGVDYWNTFLMTSSRGESISMRVVYFNSERCWFTDIYYNAGRYTLYTKDIYSERQVGPYNYLVKIEGEDTNGQQVGYFVLTDEPDLGSEYVLSLSRLCDIEAERDLTFSIVEFTTYFQP